MRIILKIKLKRVVIKIFVTFTNKMCEKRSITIISIDCLFIYKNKDYLQVYLDKCVYKIVEKQMARYLDHDLIEFVIKIGL